MITCMPRETIHHSLRILVFSIFCTLSSCTPVSSLQGTITSGIDVSRYQGVIDWKKVQMSGITFAIAKATQGTTYIDPMFAKNSAGIHNANITFGAYHFLTPDEPGDAQARHFLSVTKLKSGDLPPIIDTERISKDSGSKLVEIIFGFRDEIMRQTGHQVMIYVSPAFWNEYVKPHLDKPLSNPLWIAEYDVSEPQSLTHISPWSIWQHSKTGSCDGITGHVDLNTARNLDTILIP